MPLSFATRETLIDRERRTAVIGVQSKLTWYQVVITPDTITLLGPGLEEDLDRDDYPQDLTMEGLALLIVITKEESV